MSQQKIQEPPQQIFVWDAELLFDILPQSHQQKPFFDIKINEDLEKLLGNYFDSYLAFDETKITNPEEKLLQKKDTVGSSFKFPPAETFITKERIQFEAGDQSTFRTLTIEQKRALVAKCYTIRKVYDDFKYTSGLSGFRKFEAGDQSTFRTLTIEQKRALVIKCYNMINAFDRCKYTTGLSELLEICGIDSTEHFSFMDGIEQLPDATLKLTKECLSKVFMRSKNVVLALENMQSNVVGILGRLMLYGFAKFFDCDNVFCTTPSVGSKVILRQHELEFTNKTIIVISQNDVFQHIFEFLSRRNGIKYYFIKSLEEFNLFCESNDISKPSSASSSTVKGSGPVKPCDVCNVFLSPKSMARHKRRFHATADDDNPDVIIKKGKMEDEE
uniref:C2H2-type domain-containing protein n=1 Tax=Meloidogyne javanica TaxID=6303 RepID=A0A915LFP3_MELJA